MFSETPVASPRRVCSIPTNKRVEMLRQCEADLRREINKAQKQNDAMAGDHFDQPPPSAQHAQENINQLVNRRIEVLKLETAQHQQQQQLQQHSLTPNSPNKTAARFSPRKTHVSNFIHLNTSPTDLMRRKCATSPAEQPQQPQPPNGADNTRAAPRAVPSNSNGGRRLLNFPKSPQLTRRRFRSQSPRVACAIDSDSDSSQADALRSANRRTSADRRPLVGQTEWNGNHPHHKRNSSSVAARRHASPSVNARRQRSRDGQDALNSNARDAAAGTQPTTQTPLEPTVSSRNPLLSFRSVDMGARLPEAAGYCPQSEPLKRKVYSGSHTLEKLKKTLEQESGTDVNAN